MWVFEIIGLYLPGLNFSEETVHLDSSSVIKIYCESTINVVSRWLNEKFFFYSHPNQVEHLFYYEILYCKFIILNTWNIEV